MKLARAALALLLLASPAVAQVSPGQLGVTKNVDPQTAYIRDDLGNWVTIGTMSAGVFSPIASGGTFTWPGTADVATGGTAAPGGGTMPYVNAYLQSNATVYTNNAADAAPTVSGPLNAVDTGITCVTTPSSQSACTGTPTASSSLTAAITAAGYIGVQASITGGTANVTVQMEVSQDAITYYGRGLFLDTQLAPIWKNTLAVPFSGLTPGGGVSSYRARIVSFTPLTGSPVVTITIRQGQSSNFMYIGNLPTSANGAGAAAAVNIQGNGNTMNPVLTDARQQAGLVLANPTAPGSPAGSGLVPTVNAVISGGVTASFSGYSPASYAAAGLAASTTSSSITAPAGATVVLFNTDTTNFVYTTKATGSATATLFMDQIAPGGCFAYVQTGTQVLAAITRTGTALVNVSGGSGWPLGCGGGGAGGTGTFTWPGTAGLGTLGATGSGTAPYVNSYIPGTVTTVNPAIGAFGGAGPASGAAMGANGPGTFDPVVQTHASVPISISTATTTRLVPLVSNQAIYVTTWNVIAGGTGNFTLEYGVPTQTWTASFATNVMTLTGVPTGTDGVFAGEVISATGVTAGTTIVALTGGAANTIGATYSLSTSPGTLATRTVTATGPNPCNVATPLTGAYSLTAQTGAVVGAGLGPVLVTPASVNLCALTSAPVSVGGSLGYVQF